MADLFQTHKDYWYEATKGSSPDAAPVLFPHGLFAQMAINLGMGSRVKSGWHIDYKNIIWGFCVIFAFGEPFSMTLGCQWPGLIWSCVQTGFFPDGTQSWLVNKESGIVIQIPSGVFYAFSSALQIHWNVDKHGVLLHLLGCVSGPWLNCGLPLF